MDSFAPYQHTPVPKSGLSSEQTVVLYYDLYNQRKWTEAWLYLKQETDEPQITRRQYVAQQESIAKHNWGFAVKAKVLEASSLSEWDAPRRTIRIRDKNYPNTPEQVRQGGVHYQDVAVVKVLITWVPRDQPQWEEQRDLH